MPLVTKTISSTVDVDDCFMYSNPTFHGTNFGATTAVLMGKAQGDTYRSVIRIDKTKIPLGTLSAVRLKMTRVMNPNSTASSLIDVYRIKDANTWVEGNGSVFGGDPIVGAMNWDRCVYDTQAWAGSVGCGTSGTDYDADASPPSVAYASMTSGPDTLYTIDLPTTWFENWRDGVHVNNGFMMRSRSESEGSTFVAYSTEGASPLSIEIDFTGPNQLFFKMI